MQIFLAVIGRPVVIVLLTQWLLCNAVVDWVIDWLLCREQWTMPPVGDSRDVRSIIQEHIDQNKVAIFCKSYCSFCKKVWFALVPSCLSVCRTVVAKSKVLWPLIAFVPSCHSVILASATELSSSGSW